MYIFVLQKSKNARTPINTRVFAIWQNEYFMYILCINEYFIHIIKQVENLI